MENIGSDRENLNDFLALGELQQYFELFRDILKVSKVSQLKFVVAEDLDQIGLSKPEQRRYNKLYSRTCPNSYIAKLKRILGAGSKRPEIKPSYDPPVAIPLEVQTFPDYTVKGTTKHIISIEDITINKELGMGQFGVVQQGTWATENQRLQVAIKCLGQERVTSSSTEFLKEAAVMHSIEHPNIVRLYGVVLHMDSLMLVTELAPLRSLLECLREVSLRTSFPVPNLCEFAEQICDGMTYLENKRLIHRDLAARNILVFNKGLVKISDFGLSRALGVGKDYYQTNYNVNLKLPVAWCAPECILYLKFTSSSDVWAFGVCLWEMFTYGFQPWAAFSGQQILEAIDVPNLQRLEKPECCPEEYYEALLECWAQRPTARPKFCELGPKLRQIRPEEVQAVSSFVRPENGRRANMLEYKAGDLITVLGKESMTKSALWYGVLAGGACGMFDPSRTKLYYKADKGSTLASISPHPTRQSSRTIRSSILRSDVTRHTFTGKRTIQPSMISSPQGEVKHTGHVGLDGAYFGDISFLDSTGQPPRQVVTPYKPSEDMEQQPLINPNSPSHLSGDTKTKTLKKPSNKFAEPSTSKRFLDKVKCATLGLSHRMEENAAAKIDDVHEYHEISDTDTESFAAEIARREKLVNPESPGIPKGYGDFGQSLLEEMESMFRNLDGRRREEAVGAGKNADGETIKSHTLSKTDKKKQVHTSTMKPMSAHEEKTLATAVAMANEITTKSMNDLDGEPKQANPPSDRSKFHFKFPQLSLHSHAQHDTEKETTGKPERRNFSEEVKCVPDIQSIFTEESKNAYTSLIEQPCSSMMAQTTTMPKPTQRADASHFRSLQKQHFPGSRHPTIEFDRQAATDVNPYNIVNELPLPPRNTKPKLVDKPRHVRKYPLKLPTKPPPEPPVASIIYQNAIRQPSLTLPELPPPLPPVSKKPTMSATSELPTTSKTELPKEVDANDGKDGYVDTNPFMGASGSANPFDRFLDDIDYGLSIDAGGTDDDDDDETDKAEGLLKDCTDHVSVEDLLEFADQKPCGRQRGVESDEVRIMSKVLKEQVQPEECLQALELSDWNVHRAIKVVRVRVAVEAEISLQECSSELDKTAGDIVKASAAILLGKNEIKQ